MKKFKKLITILLALTIVVTAIPVTVFASEVSKLQNEVTKENYFDNEDTVNDEYAVIRKEDTVYGETYYVLHKVQLQNKNLKVLKVKKY